MYKTLGFLLIFNIFMPKWAYSNDPVIINDGSYAVKVYAEKYKEFRYPQFNYIFSHICSTGQPGHKGDTFNVIPTAIWRTISEVTHANNQKIGKKYPPYIEKEVFRFTDIMAKFKPQNRIIMYNGEETMIPFKPQNKMIWNTHSTSDLAFIVVNGKSVHPTLPKFECTLWGNTVTIQYVYGLNTLGANNPHIIYGDTYPSQQEIEKQRKIHGFEGSGVDSYKFMGLFVNGHRIVNFVTTDLVSPWFDIKYTLNPETQKYYIDIESGIYSYNGTDSQGVTKYAESNGNVYIQEFNDRGYSHIYKIKLYHNITQPDGTVSP